MRLGFGPGRERGGQAAVAVAPVPCRGRVNTNRLACAFTTGQHSGMSVYDSIARIYDPWSRTVTEDVPFYVEEARRTGGPVVELCVGTGRIAVPIAVEGIPVIGIDSSPGMLEVAAETASLAGVELDLRLGDLREPPLEGEFPLVIIPFRSLLHMQTDDDRRAALRAVRGLLEP